MTVANPSNYWISGNALRITLNANGDADYIQGNTASGAMILCFIKSVEGLGYDAGHNYQRWKLLLSPTYFATKSAKYVYVAIPRAGKKVPQDFAQVVFPSEKLDIYGKNASEQQIGSTDYYYIWLQGIISASEVGGVLQDRVWTAQIQTGTLASDEAYESGGDSTWWRYSSVSDTVTFLKTITHAVFERMRITTRLIFGNSDDSENYVSGVANNNTSDTSEHDIVTPAYGKEKFLSRKNNDTAQGWITFVKGLRTIVDFVSGATGSGGAFYQEQSGTYSRAHLETDVARIREMLLGSLDVEENLHVGGSETIGTSAAGQNTMADGTTVDNYRQKVGGNARIDGVLVALSKIYSNLLRSQNFNGDGLFDSGFELTKDDGTGHSYLVVDKLYVRLKAIFEALEIRKMIYSGGNFIFSHAGGKVVKVREIREELTASVDGNTLNLAGPVNITGSTLHIDGGARVENGTLVITGESTLYAYRCYFLTDDGTTRTENWWQVDDQARCQTFNIKEGVYEHVSNQSYWRRVLAVGRETLDDGKEYDYVDLSVVDCMPGSTVPKEGDDLVQCGNRTDTERQGFITLEITGEYAPALKIYRNVNGYTTNGKRKICLSPKYTELIVNKYVQETEYDVQPVPMERGDWEKIPGNRCYYYNIAQHNGGSWLCIYPEEGINGVLYTVEEPSENAVWWRPYAQRGKDGEDGKSFNIKGTFDTYAEFDAAEKVYEEGVAYVVAGFLYVYDPLANNFKNAGQFKGDPGRGIKSATISYGVSDSSSATPNEWKSSPSALALEQGVYLWVRTILVYTDGEQSSPSYNISYFGKDGSFKNTVFCRTNTDISSLQPKGGTWDNPVPNPSSGVVWSDGIPAGESRLWATSAVFSPTGQMSEWTMPKSMTDTTDTDVEFSPSTAKPANPSDVVSEREAQGWYDPDRNPSFDFTTTIWRAERHCKNGVWGNWAVERIKGEKGDSITIDTQKSKTEYAASSQGTSAPSSGWSTTIPSVPQGQFLWTRVTTVYSDGLSTVSYGVSYNAEDGANGADGTSVTITSKSVKYAVTNNGTQPADSSFTYSSIPPLALGQYLWTKTEVVYSDGNSTKAYSVSRLGTDGAQGIQGPNGKTTHFAYAKMKAGQSIPSTGKITTAMVDSWSRTNFPGADAIGTYDDTTTEDSENIADYTWTEWKGEKGDSITIDAQKSKTEYAASNQGTSAPSSGWSTTIPSVPQGQFLWTRVTTAYSDGSSTVSYGVSYNAEDGTPGTSITITSKSVKYAVTNNGTQPADSSFTYNAIPSSLELGQYLWTKTEVAYSDGNSTKAYSVSRLGTDGAQGIQGPNGKTTHFAYAKMKAGQSIPSTGKITTAMVDSWSMTNFPGADAIGTYDDTTTEDSENIADYTWTEWKGDKGEKGDKGDKGDSGSSAASVVLDTSVISVPVDTDGYVIDNFRAEVGVRLYVAGKDVVATEISIDEQDGSLVSAPANALAAMPWATDADYELNDGQINFKRNASINGNTLVLTGDAWAVVPDRLIVEVKKGTLLREHAANLTVGGSDEDKNYIEGFASIAIQRQYVPTNGREGADAVSVMLTKYNVILNQQQSGAKTIPLDDAYTDVMVYVGEVNVTGNAVITATPSKVDDQSVCTVSVSGGRVTITSIGTYKETVDGKEKTYYYDKGEVNIQVSYNGKKYPLVFGFSCNLLGTWKEETENDVNRAVAEKINYLYDEENPNQVVKQADYAEYVRSATENTSKISQRVESVESGKNLIKQLTSGWVGTDPSDDSITYLDRFGIEDDSNDMYSPVIRLKANTDYCFSAEFVYSPEYDSAYVIEPVSERTYQNGKELYDSGYGTTPQITWHNNGDRYYFTFRTGESDTLFAFNYYAGGDCILYRPQMEEGETPTEFYASSYEQSSLVKQTKDALVVQINGKASHSEVTQTAENIVAKVNETGIDIENKKITLNSATTEISNNGKTAAMFEDGKIKADYINVAKLIAQQLLTEADSSGIQVKIEKGLMEVYGQKGVANWRFGIDDSGNTILAYYNNSGQKLYDLGPNGISSINNFYESWGEDRTKSVLTKDYNISYGTSGTLNNLVFGSAVFYRNIFSGGHTITPTYVYGARKTDTGSSVTYYGKDEAPDVTYAANSAVAQAADKKEFWNKEDLNGCTTPTAVNEKIIRTFIAVRVSEEPLQPINFNGMPSSEINRVLTQVKAQYYTPNESYYATLLQTAGIPFVFPTVDTVSQYPLYMRTIVDANNNTFTLLSNNKW